MHSTKDFGLDPKANVFTAADRPSRGKCLGTSLLELMVAVAIMSIIIVAAFMVMNEGLQLYRANKRAADAQVSLLMVLTRVTAEAVNAKSNMVEHYPNSSAPSALAGIVFASPLLPGGRTRMDPDTAEMYWQSWICYYLVPGTENGDGGKIYRAEIPIPPDNGAGPGSKDVTGVVLSGLTSRTTDFFQNSPNTERRLMGDDIASFSVLPYAGTVGEKAGLSAGAGVLVHKSYDIVLEAGNKNNRRSDGYYIQVDSRVTPRG